MVFLKYLAKWTNGKLVENDSATLCSLGGGGYSACSMEMHHFYETFISVYIFEHSDEMELIF